jgi:hypothetical protein
MHCILSVYTPDIRLQIACRRYTADMGPSAQGFPDGAIRVETNLSVYVCKMSVLLSRDVCTTVASTRFQH